MNDWNGFGSLDLSGVSAEEGRKTLKPGSYVCIVKNAKIEPTANGSGRKLVVELHEENGAGHVTDYINVFNKSQQATDIGLRRLKSLLVAGGHPNPDHPGDVNTINGLRVGVHVEAGEDWVDDKGEKRPGGGKPRKSGAYFSPLENAATAARNGSAAHVSAGAPYSDRIPFAPMPSFF